MLPNFVTAILIVVVFVFVTREGLSQECFSQLNCVGDPIDAPGPSASNCCDDTSDGRSYGLPSNCYIPQCKVPFRVAFVQTMYTVAESSGAVEVCVNLTFPRSDILDEQVTVLVYHNDNSIYLPPTPALATPDPPGNLSEHTMISLSDYEEETLGSSTIRDTFIKEERRLICYDQVIYDDLRLELTETTGLGLVPDDPDNVVVVEPYYGDSVVFIIDDDVALVGLERTIFTVSEDVGVVEVCAVIYHPHIDCPIQFPFQVKLTIADGTAVSPTDYAGLSTWNLQFYACEIIRCTLVNIAIDLIDEPVESFSYTLERTFGLDSRISLDPVAGSVEIFNVICQDCDEVLITVGYEFTVHTTSEGVGAIDLSIVVTDPPTGGAPRPFSLSVTTQDGTAVSPEDYVSVSGQILQFNTGDERVTHTIAIHQDQLCEDSPNDRFFSRILFDSGVQPVNIFKPVAEIIIDDSLEIECDPLHVGYEHSVYTTTESQQRVHLCVIIYNPPTGGATHNFSLIVSTRDGSAASSDDYDAVLYLSLNFTVGQTEACYSLNITDDDICETENFFASLEDTSGTMSVLIHPSDTQVNIDDTNESECGQKEDTTAVYIATAVVSLLFVLIVATALIAIVCLKRKRKRQHVDNPVHLYDVPDYSRNAVAHQHVDNAEPQGSLPLTAMKTNIAYGLVAPQQHSSEEAQYSEVVQF